MKVTNIGDGLDHYDTLIREGADRSQIAFNEGSGWRPIIDPDGYWNFAIKDKWQYALIDQRTDYDIMRAALEAIAECGTGTSQGVAKEALDSLTGDSGSTDKFGEALREITPRLDALWVKLSNRTITGPTLRKEINSLWLIGDSVLEDE